MNSQKEKTKDSNNYRLKSNLIDFSQLFQEIPFQNERLCKKEIILNYLKD